MQLDGENSFMIMHLFGDDTNGFVKVCCMEFFWLLLKVEGGGFFLGFRAFFLFFFFAKRAIGDKSCGSSI